ncbi:MAG: FGGY family carbohydrate kinase, partial [Thermocladium sp.]
MGVGSHVLVIDQGTSSTRASIIDSGGNMIGWSSREHSQIYPRPSWVEHDPLE